MLVIIIIIIDEYSIRIIQCLMLCSMQIDLTALLEHIDGLL